MKTRNTGNHRVAKLPLLVACVMLGLIAAFFFMHGGHGHAGHRDPPSSADEESR